MPPPNGNRQNFQSIFRREAHCSMLSKKIYSYGNCTTSRPSSVEPMPIKLSPPSSNAASRRAPLALTGPVSDVFPPKFQDSTIYTAVHRIVLSFSTIPHSHNDNPKASSCRHLRPTKRPQCAERSIFPIMVEHPRHLHPFCLRIKIGNRPINIVRNIFQIVRLPTRRINLVERIDAIHMIRPEHARLLCEIKPLHDCKQRIFRIQEMASIAIVESGPFAQIFNVGFRIKTLQL